MKKIYYGWYVAAAGFLIIAAASGMVSNCMALFIVPVCDDLGFSRGEMGVNQTIYSAGCVVVALFAGPLYKRFKLKRLMQLGAITLIISYALYTRASSLWMFYACSCIAALSVALITWMPFSIIINNWFHKRRGFAMGLAFMGSGVGGMLASALGGQMIATLGWRSTMLAFSGVLVIVVLPCVFLLVRTRPEDMGLKPYGEAPDAAYANPEKETDGTRFKDALGTSRLFVILACLAVLGLAFNGFTCTLNAYLRDIGYTGTFSSLVYSAFMFLIAGGKLLMGALYDRAGTRKATAISLTLTIVTMLALALAKHTAALVIMLAACTLGIPFGTVALPLLARALYGKRDYTAFAGAFSAASNIGCAIAPTLLGLVHDTMGGYAPGYYFIAFSVLISGALIVTRIPKRAI